MSKRPNEAELAALVEISVPEPLLAYHGFRTVEIAKAIRAGGALPTLTVAERDGRYVLVEGKDEFAALKLVGIGMAPVRIVEESRPDWRRKEPLWKRRMR
jgi:hypothetical protein